MESQAADTEAPAATAAPAAPAATTPTEAEAKTPGHNMSHEEMQGSMPHDLQTEAEAATTAAMEQHADADEQATTALASKQADATEPQQTGGNQQVPATTAAAAAAAATTTPAEAEAPPGATIDMDAEATRQAKIAYVQKAMAALNNLQAALLEADAQDSSDQQMQEQVDDIIRSMPTLPHAPTGTCKQEICSPQPKRSLPHSTQEESPGSEWSQDAQDPNDFMRRKLSFSAACSPKPMQPTPPEAPVSCAPNPARKAYCQQPKAKGLWQSKGLTALKAQARPLLRRQACLHWLPHPFPCLAPRLLRPLAFQDSRQRPPWHHGKQPQRPRHQVNRQSTSGFFESWSQTRKEISR